jgi:DNA-binding transcriptional LysR family regulator
VLNIKQLETFLWIARLGSFASAADRLNSTQSTVSVRIHELEQSLGVKLFDRSRRVIQLTPKGVELLPKAEQLVEMVWSIESTIGDAHSIAGNVRIGVADVVALTWLGALVAAVRDGYPSVMLEIDVGLAVDLVDKLRRRELDMVLTPADRPSLEFEGRLLGKVDFVWMASPSMALPTTKVTPAMLQAWPVVTLSEQSFHYNAVNRWFRENAAKCERVITCNSISVLISLVKKGMGIGLVPAPCVDSLVKESKLRVVDTKPETEAVPFYALTPLDTAMPLAEQIACIAVKVSNFGNLPSFAIGVQG